MLRNTATVVKRQVAAKWGRLRQLLCFGGKNRIRSGYFLRN
jgi:hypothetical protein